MNRLEYHFEKQSVMSLPNLLEGNPQREQELDIALLEEEQKENKLVLWNDDFNTFDFVISCLIEICNHTLEQAEQCTILVHYKGKCTVKTGRLELLKPMHEKLLSRGLTSEIQ